MALSEPLCALSHMVITGTSALTSALANANRPISGLIVLVKEQIFKFQSSRAVKSDVGHSTSAWFAQTHISSFHRRKWSVLWASRLRSLWHSGPRMIVISAGPAGLLPKPCGFGTAKGLSQNP